MWWLLAAIGVGALVWKGQQYIIEQPTDTVWFSDPYQYDSHGVGGTGTFYVGSNPPGEAPPWRLASEQEQNILASYEIGS